MGGVRALALVVICATLSFLPLAAGESEEITVPAPRAGDVARLDHFVVYSNGTTGTIRPNVWTWTTPIHDRTDTVGTARRVYEVSRACESCPSGTYVVDAALRASLLAENEFVSSSRGPGDAPLDLVESETTGRSGSAAVALQPEWLAQGRTVRAGDVLVLEHPAVRIEVVAKGWEILDGVRLFRMDRAAPGTTYQYYYDGAAPVPARTLLVAASGLWAERRLAAFEPGSGPALVDAAYAPPPLADRDAAAPRGTYTRDGPDDAFPGLRPTEAAAAVRADPRAVAWFAERPDAYVSWGEGGPRFWHLRFAAGTEHLIATVEATPAGPVATQVAAGRLYSGSHAPFAGLDGAPVACAHAATVARRELGERADGAAAYRFETDADGGVACVAEFRDGGALATARVDARTARALEWGESATRLRLLPGAAGGVALP